ncbi:winged helix-turn-helix domain-containing protein [Methylocystis sp. Sn-Cys]|uniref:winged helix-turn-helix domain-containing protein n=1 Tax=Methylocystis sp. Sn-Cys TaxID=1701263 RepID=UPI0019211875|nr:winged helix-turn-helix domain-containing protein [Methylocystis sp. Sn-Cys]MBL1258307.1 winged helix-turn-helix domain-containing protein [Methylocystis sp. Sn-Cys]
MVRRLLIAASPGLYASLAQQFSALGGYALSALDEGTGSDRADAAVLDGAFCDAPSLARGLREAGFASAIVIIGADAPDADTVLARPFRFADLLAALEPAPPKTPQLGARLTEKEAAILDRLIRARGAIVTKAELLADVWGYGPSVSTRTLETHIHRLRKKVETDPRRPQKLLTEDGGYRIEKWRAANLPP